MLVKYATMWFLTLPLSPCNLYVLLTYHLPGLLFTLALAGDIAFFIYRVHNVVFNACMYIHVWMYVMYTFVCIPHRNTYYIIIRLCPENTE